MEKERIRDEPRGKKEGYSRGDGEEVVHEEVEAAGEEEEERRVRTRGGSRRAVLDSSPGAVGMSMSGSRRGPRSRTPAT